MVILVMPRFVILLDLFLNSCRLIACQLINHESSIITTNEELLPQYDLSTKKP